MRAGEKDEGFLSYKLANFLLSYWTTPHATTGISPAELFIKCALCTRLAGFTETVITVLCEIKAGRSEESP